jgi:hypothetical protein
MNTDVIMKVQSMDIDFLPNNCKRKNDLEEISYKRQRLQPKYETIPIFSIKKWHDRNHLSIRGDMILFIVRFLKEYYGNSISVIKKAKQIESMLYSTSGCLLDYIDRNDVKNRIDKIILTQFF